MKKYIQLKEIFESKEDQETARTMSKYMKHLFEFYGLPTQKEEKSIMSLSNWKRNQKQ